MITIGLLEVLVAEDDETDVLLLQRAFRQMEVPNPLQVAPDGHEAIAFLERIRAEPERRLPALVILDLKMPRKTGLQVLQWIRSQPVIRSLPVVIFSSSSNQHDIEAAYDAGANAFLIKPPSTAERNELVRFLKDWLRFSQPPLAASDSFAARRRQCPPE